MSDPMQPFYSMRRAYHNLLSVGYILAMQRMGEQQTINAGTPDMNSLDLQGRIAPLQLTAQPQLYPVTIKPHKPHLQIVSDTDTTKPSQTKEG